MAMTADQRRRKNRERMRLKREAERVAGSKPGARPVHSARAQDTSAQDEPPKPAPTTMRDSVTTSLAAMKWLVDSDEAAKTQARMLAEDVDVLRHAGDIAKALSAQRALTKVLNDLGGTPMRRMMHELRSMRGSGEVPDDEDDTDEVAPEGTNVTQFERPPKRRAS